MRSFTVIGLDIDDVDTAQCDAVATGVEDAIECVLRAHKSWSRDGDAGDGIIVKYVIDWDRRDIVSIR